MVFINKNKEESWVSFANTFISVFDVELTVRVQYILFGFQSYAIDDIFTASRNV